jgi:hypothetical protein
MEVPQFERELIHQSNSGKVLDVACSPQNNALITVGQDGAVRLYDITRSN